MVLLLVNDPDKEHSPEQTRNRIVEALLDDRAEERAYPSTSGDPSAAGPSQTPFVPFGRRLREDGSPVPAGGPYKRPRKGFRRKVAVHKIRSPVTSTTATAATTSTAATVPSAAANDGDDGTPGLSSDSDARAVELLKSLYSIASKWS